MLRIYLIAIIAILAGLSSGFTCAAWSRHAEGSASLLGGM